LVETDVLILGGGLAGLAAAAELQHDAVVLERGDRPGGLVRTYRFGDYWFDLVIHLLHFSNAELKARITALLDGVLQPCPPIAWVECSAGAVRYPLQLHLGGLESATALQCAHDFAAVAFNPPATRPANYEEMLLQTFGRTMCETFFLPYNRKMWKRPLASLAPSGFVWNIARPDFRQVLQGLMEPAAERAVYNGDGWYPRPATDATARGMEVLSQALASQAHDLRLSHAVEEVDLERRLVTAQYNGELRRFHYKQACCSTLPLPRLIAMCKQAPPSLRRACATLSHNRVWSVALSIRGSRPANCGHWRYYADESIVFNRLVFLHEFDPQCAPPDGWALLAEITEPAEAPLPDADDLLQRVEADLLRTGILPDDSTVIDRHLLLADPAYVVFTPASQAIVTQAAEFLEEYGISPLGRYGRWEYSSMAQVMHDGFEWAGSLRHKLQLQRLAEAEPELIASKIVIEPTDETQPLPQVRAVP
jgi:protoporphyrinogen oxidase